ncbi:MAG: hypothetical protein RIB47_01325 [Cyclobacteriaceae bacterium]
MTGKDFIIVDYIDKREASEKLVNSLSGKLQLILGMLRNGRRMVERTISTSSGKW